MGGLLDTFQRRRRAERLLAALEDVHRRYNAAGITSVIERGADLARLSRLRDSSSAEGRQRVRATVTLRVASDGSVEGTEAFIRSLPFRFGDGDDWLRVGPLKIVADGGILAGTAYMREPYGPAAASLYGSRRSRLPRLPDALAPRRSATSCARGIGWAGRCART